jgi:hypothetical protein
MRYEGNAEDRAEAPMKGFSINALASVVDMIAAHRDGGEQGLRFAMNQPTNMAISSINGPRWALAAKCAVTKDGNDSDLNFQSAEAVHKELCKDRPSSQFCLQGGFEDECSALTGGEVETYIRRVQGDLRKRMHPDR